MAGCTSRIFLKLTVPSILLTFTAFWFLKKRKSSVFRSLSENSDCVNCSGSLKNSDCESLQNSVISMKLGKSRSTIAAEEASDLPVAGEVSMQLKEEENQATSAKMNTKVSGKRKKKSKSKSQGNTASCSSKTLTNGMNLSDTVGEIEDKGGDSGIELHYAVESLTINESSTSKQDNHDSSDVSNSASCISPESPVGKNMNGASDANDTQEADKKSKKQSKSPAVKVTDTNGVSNSENIATDNKSTTVNKNDTTQPQSSSESSDGLCNGKQEATSCNTAICPENGETVRQTLASPEVDRHSEGSNDSGKGCSEFHFNGGNILPAPSQVQLLNYEFEIAQELCGLLIGRNGRFVKRIHEDTNAEVIVKRHPFFYDLKLCSIIGTEEQITAALARIRKKFPLEAYPSLTLAQINGVSQILIPPSLQLPLPDSVSVDVAVSSVVTAGHFFVQQPTHPTYFSLASLSHRMTSWYTEFEAPHLSPSFLTPGTVCVAQTGSGWYRVAVHVPKPDTDSCIVKYLDFGGYKCLPITSLRQISINFMEMPFQASECYLANVTYLEGEDDFSPEAKATFEELAQGIILQAFVIDYTHDGKPMLHLHKLQGATYVFINKALVEKGLARWIETEPQKNLIFDYGS